MCTMHVSDNEAVEHFLADLSQHGDSRMVPIHDAARLQKFRLGEASSE
jgi:hypothetical protein